MKLFKKDETIGAKPATIIKVSKNEFYLYNEKSTEFCNLIKEFLGLPSTVGIVSIHASADKPDVVEIETIDY